MQNGTDKFNLILERMTGSLKSKNYMQQYYESDDSKLLSFFTLL